MTKVEKLEHEVRSLSAKELASFRAWFAEFDAIVWDRQIEADAEGGKLDHLAEIRQLERERLRSLVSADLATARRLHADDFQLINPAGAPLSKTEYLTAIESGQLDYRAWEAGEISVRLYGDVAMIRYRDVRFDVDRQGQPVHPGPMYHTNLYERRGGQWQVVWSQASGVITP